MKITSVDIYRVDLKEKPNPGWVPICIKINTDEGVCGWGETGIPAMAGGIACVGMLMDLSKLIIGKDPMQTEMLWDLLYHNSYWGQGGGVIIFACISAIDIALWDIKGKVAGLPVYQLLGGKTNEKLRAYGSQIQLGWGKNPKPPVTPEEYAQQAKNAVDDGYDCLKVDPFWTDQYGLCSNPQKVYKSKEEISHWRLTGLVKNEVVSTVSDRIGAIRDAVGPNVDIIIEFHGMTDTNSAIQIGRELDQYNCLYYEEGTSNINPEFTMTFKRNVKTPIATGERLFSRWSFKPLFESRAVDVAQPDTGVVGGISELKKVCDLAYMHDINIQVHNMAGPIANAATLHVESVIPNFLLHEDLLYNTSPHYKKVGKYPCEQKDGSYIVPELPGIGQELSELAIAESEITVVS